MKKDTFFSWRGVALPKTKRIMFVMLCFAASTMTAQEVFSWKHAAQEGAVFMHGDIVAVVLPDGETPPLDAVRKAKSAKSELIVLPKQGGQQAATIKVNLSRPLAQFVLPIKFTTYSTSTISAQTWVEVTSANGQKPALTYVSKAYPLDKSNGKIVFDRLENPLVFSFDEPVSSVVISWGTVGVTSGPMPAMSIGDFSWTDSRSAVLPNPVIENSDCEYDLTVLLDASASITSEEQLAISTGLSGAISSLLDAGYIFNIETIRFGSDAQTLGTTEKATKMQQSVQSIEEYRGKAPSRMSATSWKVAFEAYFERPHPRKKLILLITDGPPGSNKNGDAQVELAACTELANRAKLNGVRVLAIGLGDITTENAQTWFGPISADTDYKVATAETLQQAIIDLLPRCVVAEKPFCRCSIAPNPVQQTASFTSLGIEHTGLTLQVFNAAGNMVLAAPIANSQQILDFSSLPTGTYMSVLVQAEQVIWSEKLQIVR